MFAVAADLDADEEDVAMKFGRRSDVWAFGILMYAVIVKGDPWVRTASTSGGSKMLSGMQVEAQVRQGKRPEDMQPLPQDTPQELKELMRDCLSHGTTLFPSARVCVD